MSERSQTKGERRQRKRESSRKMRMIGSSVRLLMEIIRERAERTLKKPPQSRG